MGLYWSIDRDTLDRHATGGRAARSSDSELAQQLVMDPYVLKHLGLVQRLAERAVEQALMGRRQILPSDSEPGSHIAPTSTSPIALPKGIGTAFPICRAIAVFDPTHL